MYLYVYIQAYHSEYSLNNKDMTKDFIFVGPALFGGARQETVEFPWDQLDSTKPLIYVSMGTLYYQVCLRGEK